ncbi:MAG: hypothetical protein V9F01_03410 [Chitinophagaceae bacterium]
MQKEKKLQHLQQQLKTATNSKQIQPKLNDELRKLDKHVTELQGRYYQKKS